MTRLEQKMTALKEAGRKALIIYITAGATGVKETVGIVREAERVGADVIELGLPFSDPMADGPVIQEASVMALKNGTNLAGILDMVCEIRKRSAVPLVGMGYINNVHHYGYERFVHDFKAAGMDGIIVPDLPHEESKALRTICAGEAFHLAEFITPGTREARMKKTCKGASGFIYCVSNNGVTGVRKTDYTVIGAVCKKARSYTKTPLAIGFGIGSPKAAVEAAAYADGVIVGSAVVKPIISGNRKGAMELICAMRTALDQAY